ncbi:hypothetical protein E2562_008980 [Oryza meyeriana var. granulata]|uniref:Uncharacterized protein n=1 Tax=Oryza meyeriana var. granulata TaxID=110450 RepID=A0A6G1CZS0_9ORYZ|nr:hypothetical protein E2562_008980 [Oryza meyeriana var. granulata]
MAYGVSVVGVLPALLTKGPLEVIRDHYTKMGSIFSLHCAISASEGDLLGWTGRSSHFFKGLDSEISQDEVSRFAVLGVAFDVNYATRQEHYRFFGDTTKPAKLRSLMVHEVEVCM